MSEGMDLFEDCASDVVTYCTHLTGYVMVALESRRGEIDLQLKEKVGMDVWRI